MPGLSANTNRRSSVENRRAAGPRALLSVQLILAGASNVQIGHRSAGGLGGGYPPDSKPAGPGRQSSDGAQPGASVGQSAVQQTGPRLTPEAFG